MFRQTCALIPILMVVLVPEGASQLGSNDGPIVGPELGVPADSEEIETYQITVFPNGDNLPDGRGTVAEGKRLYRHACVACHGPTGAEGPSARLAGADEVFLSRDPQQPDRPPQANPLLFYSVGSHWPYATTIFDFVRRGMPHHHPKSLSDDDVYAITAYILHLNGLLRANGSVDRASLPRIPMPARTRERRPDAGLSR